MDDDGATLLVRTPDASYSIEPVRRWIPDAAPGLHMIYETGSAQMPRGQCGTDGAIEAIDQGDSVATAGEGLCFAELACDTDFEYFQALGASVPAVEAEINAVINMVNLQYETELQISHQLTTIIVRTAEPDPYTANESEDLLCQFITEWTDNQSDIARDLAKLFSGRELDTAIIGQAAAIGETGVCVSDGACEGGQFGLQGSYCYSINTFDPDPGCKSDLAAHELGHLWGAFHCNCPSNTMNWFLTCSNTFAAPSINAIFAYRDGLDCLTGSCGDGVSGACCLPDFSCDYVPESACDQAGGVFNGIGSSCALVLCGCGMPESGPCFLPGPAFCDDEECCQAVCEIDVFCCTIEWDNICVGEAVDLCLGLPEGACCVSPDSCMDGVTESQCTGLNGDYRGDGEVCADVDCAVPQCPADLNDDDGVGTLDLLLLLSAWGPCDGCPADLNGDDEVTVLDLLELLGTWGPC